MNLQESIENKNYTIYGFSKKYNIPKTTLIDLCSGKASLLKSQAITIKKIADGLGVSMEYVLSLEQSNKEYLEKVIPSFLKLSINNYKKSIKENKTLIDIYYGILQSDINNAEVNGLISSNQAWYLRDKYLGVGKND